MSFWDSIQRRDTIKWLFPNSAHRDLEVKSLEETEKHAQEMEVIKESLQSQANTEELERMSAEAEK